MERNWKYEKLKREKIFVDGYDNNPGLLVDDCTLIGYSLDRKNNRTGRYTIL